MAAIENQSCAYCLNEGSDLVDPRQLPCRHVFCLHCLERDLPQQKVEVIFKCPVCRKQHSLADSVGLKYLPCAAISTDVTEFPPHEKLVQKSCCDVCLRKKHRREAIMICIYCNIKLCAGHIEFHELLFGDEMHELLTLHEFQQDNAKLVTQFCTTNKKPKDVMCAKCNSLFCLTCWSDDDADCQTGGEHNVEPVEGVARQIKKKLSEAARPVILLLKKLDETLIQLDESRSGANTKFDNLIIDVHNARDLQLQEITAAYSHLEDRINQQRKKMLNQCKEYAEKLQAQILRLQVVSKEADELLATNNNVHVVLQSEHLIQSMTAECRCELMLPAINHVELIPIRHSRLAEVDLLVLPTQRDDEPPADIPAVIFDRRIDSISDYQTVCHTDQGYMVAGVWDYGFDYLDSAGTVVCTLKLPGNSIGSWHPRSTKFSCCASMNRVYTLDYEFNSNYLDEGNIHNFWISNYTLEGQLCCRWRAIDSACGLSVVGERVFVINKWTNCIDVYSTCGDLLYTFSHNSFIAPYRVDAADHQSVIVCDEQAHLVTKFSVWDNNAVWQYTGLENPKGAAVDKYGRIWVAANREIHVLSSEGELVVRLDLPKAEDVSNISIHEEQLAVLNSNKLLLYIISSH